MVEKSGSWFAFGSERLGQGKENVRAMLQENTELRQQIEDKLLEHLGVKEEVVERSEPVEQGEEE